MSAIEPVTWTQRRRQVYGAVIGLCAGMLVLGVIAGIATSTARTERTEKIALRLSEEVSALRVQNTDLRRQLTAQRADAEAERARARRTRRVLVAQNNRLEQQIATLTGYLKANGLAVPSGAGSGPAPSSRPSGAAVPPRHDTSAPPDSRPRPRPDKAAKPPAAPQAPSPRTCVLGLICLP